jgi:hypothetical protein
MEARSQITPEAQSWTASLIHGPFSDQVTGKVASRSNGLQAGSVNIDPFA